MIYLLDTTVISTLMRSPERRDKNVAAWLVDVNATDLGTSALAVREVWDGIVKARRDPRKADEADAYAQQAVSLFNDFDVRIVPVDRAVAEMWAELLPGRSKRSLDVDIAATARVHGLVRRLGDALADGMGRLTGKVDDVKAGNAAIQQALDEASQALIRMEKILTDLRKRDIPVPEMARKERAPSDAMGLGEPVRERDTSRQARPEAPVWQRPASNPDGTAWHPAGNN